ncbi:MAG: hypothetical protein V2J62_08535 [candidate division KSB1 bacterium]|nr:hypothetical protein [candidate division KSB1 bacterium]
MRTRRTDQTNREDHEGHEGIRRQENRRQDDTDGQRKRCPAMSFPQTFGGNPEKRKQKTGVSRQAKTDIGEKGNGIDACHREE